jgi:hypothetical protein
MAKSSTIWPLWGLEIPTFDPLEIETSKPLAVLPVDDAPDP